MNRFLVQVSKEPGYANISNNRRYQNSLWMNKKRDRDHGEVEAGDELLVYCSSTVPEHSSSLAFSVVVQKVSPDRITFELGDPQWFKSPLKREVIISLVYGLKLPKMFGKCGQQGFNIAKVERPAAHQVLALLNAEEDATNESILGNPWDEFVRHAKAIVDSGAMEHEKYKFELGRNLEAMRQAVLEGASDWVIRLKRATNNHLAPWQSRVRFNEWFESDPNGALQAMQTFWANDDTPIDERIRGLVPRVLEGSKSTHLLRGAGTRMNPISVLLMALDHEKYPPFRVMAFDRAYERTGYDKPERGVDEAALYDHALRFLDRLIEEAGARGLELPHRLDAQSVVWQSRYDDMWNLAGSIEEVEEAEPPAPQETPTAVDLPTLAASLKLNVEFLENIETLLEDKKQVIFQGPPGTGKTYVAQKLARHLAGSDKRVTLVQFHPSYAYEDFVQGFRPALVEGQPGFELRDGPLLQAADRARDEPHAKHYLVIDEINRGNLAKVFGELYFLLEYRNEEIRLQYSDAPFSLPDNLYIIGTMNTADRSIALVDLALRRRFYFVMFHPDEEPVKGVLRRWLSDRAPDMEWVADVVELANEKLSDDRHAAIGPSYFMKDGLDEDMVKRAWKHSVLPYIEERRFGGDEVSDEFDLERLRREAVSAVDASEDGQEQGGGTVEDQNGTEE